MPYLQHIVPAFAGYGVTRCVLSMRSQDPSQSITVAFLLVSPGLSPLKSQSGSRVFDSRDNSDQNPDDIRQVLCQFGCDDCPSAVVNFATNKIDSRPRCRLARTKPPNFMNKKTANKATEAHKAIGANKATELHKPD